MFCLAIIFNTLSSYLIASVLNSFLVMFVAFFALVILNIEILSLFNAINEINVFIFTILNFLFSLTFFKFKKANLLKPKLDLSRLKNSFLLDKSLIVLGIGFLSLIIVSLFLSLIMPALEPDSQTYHFLRAYEFVSQKSLNHFETNDIRALIMPINSEIFYSWLLVFKKNFHGYGIISFFAFLLSVFSMWNIFEKFKFSYRKRLYSIFLFSSLSAVIIQIPSLQTDLLVGSFLICAFSLFVDDLIYFSSLTLAIILGIKTTGLIAFLGFLVLIILYELLINKKLSKIKKFLAFLTINFLIFSSYNYILNYIQFNNFISNEAALIGHGFWGGIKGYFANLINFAFQSLDFTGFKWGYYLNEKILALKVLIFELFKIDLSQGSNVSQKIVNIITDEQTVGFGILGFLVYLPMIFVSIFKIFINKNKKTILLFLFGLTFLINILVLARSTAYMVYSIRFIVAFVCLSSVVLVGVYKKKGLIKPIILFFMLFYMFLIPFHNKRMPFWLVFNELKKTNFNLAQFEESCYQNKVIPVFESSNEIYQTIKIKYPNKKKIAILKSLESSLLYLKKLEYENYEIDFLNSSNLSKEKISKYDLIILENKVQDDNVFTQNEVIKDYKIKNNKIIFNDSKKLNCYFETPKNSNIALKRHCFSFEYLIQNKNLKLDYSQVVHIKELKKNINLYYFTK